MSWEVWSMPRKTSFCNRALLRSDVKRYWPLLFLYVAVWVMILPLPILQAGRWMVSAEQIQAEIHNTIYNALFGSIVMALLFGCLMAMAVWSYLMTTRAVGLLHALPVTRTEQFLSHSIAGLGMLTVGNVFIFLLSAACCAGRSYVDWAILGAWLLLTELMELFFFALASLCAMATGWLLAIPVLYGAVNAIAILLHEVVQAMANIFYYGYYTTGPAKAVMWLTPVGRIWTAIGHDTSYWITADGRVSPEYLEEGWRVSHLSPTAYTTCAIYAVVGLVLLALVWWLYQKRPSESAGDAMAFRWLRPIARWSIGLCGGWGLGLFLHYAVLYNSNLTQLLICQVILGVICFFAAQMLLQKKFRIFNKRWWLETAAMVLVLAAVTVCVKLDFTGYQHRVPDADDVTEVRCTGVADLTADDPETIETVVALHRAILAQHDAGITPEDSYPASATLPGEPVVSVVSNEDLVIRYLRLTYTLRDGTELRRNYQAFVSAGTDVYRLMTELANSRDNLLGLTGLQWLERYGGADAVNGGYISRYRDGAYAVLTAQQAKELVHLIYADVDSAVNVIDVLDNDKGLYGPNGVEQSISLYLTPLEGETRDISLDLPLFCTRAWEFMDGLEFDVPVDGEPYYEDIIVKDYLD